MKRLTFALIATAATALAATSARADTRVSIGVNIGGPGYIPAPPPAVVYAPAPPPAVVYAPPAPMVVAPHAHGYWKEVQVKTWVPERWVVRTSRWGRSERVCEPGYFTYRTDRVWVETGPGRGYAYGYGRDNRDYRDYRRDDRGWNR